MITNIILGVTAISTFAIYIMNLRTEKRNAASVLISDMDRAQEIIQGIIKIQQYHHEQKVILLNRNWVTYRHLFVKKFGPTDLKDFDAYFDACLDIDSAKIILDSLYIQNTIAKIGILQSMANQTRTTDTPTQIADRNQELRHVEGDEYTFRLTYPETQIVRVANSTVELKVNNGYTILEKIAKQTL